jgi:xanthine dehydrogenase accessory factor
MVAVRADGEMAGYVSHGCVDADLGLQAQDAINLGAVRQITYGVGSPFMDLRLPCGGTVEMLVDPAPDPNVCALALEHLARREAVALQFSDLAGLVSAGGDPQDVAGRFTAWHSPVLQLVVAGVGAPLAAVAGIANSMRLPLSVLSTDPEAKAYIAGSDRARFAHLTSPLDHTEFPLDRWTAVLLLFHDHDWEPNLLRTALAGNPFYIGALGSSRTHANRLAALTDLGVSAEDLGRISGPIGVIPAARDAHTLAISALAEILDAYRQVPKTAAELAKIPAFAE